MTMTSYTLFYNQRVLNLIRGLLRKGGYSADTRLAVHIIYHWLPSNWAVFWH